MGWLAGWDKRIKLTIDSGDVSAALEDFPVLVYISAASGIGDVDATAVFDEVGANSLKIAVTKADGTTECYVEIDKWDNGNEKAWIWVKVPDVASGADTILYLYYDNDHADNNARVGVTNSEVAENVWDEHFYGVFHMRDDPDNENIRDSTSNDLDGEKTAAGHPSVSTNGLIDDAQLFADDDDETDHGNATGLDGVSAFTIEFFVKPDSLPWPEYTGTVARGTTFNRCPWIYGHKNASYCRISVETVAPPGKADDANTTTANLTGGAWNYVTFAWDGALCVAHLNGVAGNEDATDGDVLIDTDGPLFLGYLPSYHFLLGLLDEVRISTNRRPIAWILASYESGRDDLITFGPEELLPVDASTDLFAIFSIRRSSTQELPAEFIPRRADSADLLGKLIVKNIGTEDLLGAFSARRSSLQELAAGFTIRHDDTAELASKFSIRRDGTTELFATFSIRRSTFKELPGEFIARHDDSEELFAKFTVRHTATPLELYSKFRVRCSRRLGGNWQRKVWHQHPYYWRARYCPTHDQIEFDYIAEEDLASNVWTENENAAIDASAFTGINADFTVRGAEDTIPTTIHYSDGADTWVAESDEVSELGWAWENLNKVFDAGVGDSYRKVNIAANRKAANPILWATAVFVDTSEGKQWVVTKEQSDSGDLSGWEAADDVSNVDNVATIYGCSARSMGATGAERDDMIWVYKEGVAIRSRYFTGATWQAIQDVDVTTIAGRAVWDLEHIETAGQKMAHLVYVDADGSVQWRERDAGAAENWSAASQLEAAFTDHFGVGIIEHGNGWSWTVWVHANILEYRLHVCDPEFWYPALGNDPLEFDPATDAVVTTSTIEQPQTPDRVDAGKAVPITWVGQTAPGTPCGIGWGILWPAAEEDLPASFIARQAGSAELSGKFTVRHTATLDLPASFDAQVSLNLPGKFIARHTDTKDLIGKFSIRRSTFKELPGEFIARRDASEELLGKFNVLNVGAENLLGKVIIRHTATVELPGKFSARRSSSQELAGQFLPRHAGSQDLICSLQVGYFGEANLPCQFSVKRPGILLDITLEERDIAISLEEREVEITLQERDIDIALEERDVTITLEERGIAISYRHEGQTMVNLGDTFQLKGECTDLDGDAEDPDSQSIKLYDVEDNLIDTDTSPTAGTPTGEYYANLEAKDTGITGAWIALWEVTVGAEKRTVRFDVEVKSLLG